VRLVAAMALGVGVGLPEIEAAAPRAAVRLQLRFYRSPSDGGQLVGTVELPDAVTAFIGSAAGARAQVKWYDWSGKEVGTTGIPSLIQDKVMATLKALPPEE
jgi:hypothetical protein